MCSRDCAKRRQGFSEDQGHALCVWILMGWSWALPAGSLERRRCRNQHKWIETSTRILLHLGKAHCSSLLSVNTHSHRRAWPAHCSLLGTSTDGSVVSHKQHVIAHSFQRICTCIFKNKCFGVVGEEELYLFCNKILCSCCIRHTGLHLRFWKDLRCVGALGC